MWQAFSLTGPALDLSGQAAPRARQQLVPKDALGVRRRWHDDVIQPFKPKPAVIRRITDQQHPRPALLCGQRQRFANKLCRKSFALPGRVHGHRPEQKRVLRSDVNRPEPDRTGKDTFRVAGDTAQPRHRRDVIAKPVGRQRLATGGKAQIVKRFDLIGILRSFWGKRVHGWRCLS